MHILINNKEVALKKNSSFEYISENRLFGDADDYTLSITLPLKDCQQNIDIFGLIFRTDVDVAELVYDCEIRDKNFQKFGCLTIIEVTETDIKCQFLSGRSRSNFDKTFDDIYVNELELGSPATTNPNNITPSAAWAGLIGGKEAVALPWVNQKSRRIQNCAKWNDSLSKYEWHNIYGLSWQPYLIVITKRILDACEYTYDLTSWEENENWKYIIICNSLPSAWEAPNYASALPHWTVQEYFQKLELFLNCEFDFDHRAKHVSFQFTDDILKNKDAIVLSKVVDEHTSTMKADDKKCDYREFKNIIYKDYDSDMWKFYSCDWFLKTMRDSDACVEYPNMTELLNNNRNLATWDGYNQRGSRRNLILHAQDIDEYFVCRAVSSVENGTSASGKQMYIYKCVLQQINAFGGRIVDDSEDAEEEEIEFVPASIDYSDDEFGHCLYLGFSGYDEDESATSQEQRIHGFDEPTDTKHFAQTSMVKSLEIGESDKTAQYYDKIYVAWWDGALDNDHMPPHPRVEDLWISDDWTHYRYEHFSLRINSQLAERRRQVHKIDPYRKTQFKFLADDMPDVRAMFLINGKRYVCEKITATFTENGMSQYMKGEFWPIID